MHLDNVNTQHIIMPDKNNFKNYNFQPFWTHKLDIFFFHAPWKTISMLTIHSARWTIFTVQGFSSVLYFDFLSFLPLARWDFVYSSASFRVFGNFNLHFVSFHLFWQIETSQIVRQSEFCSCFYCFLNVFRLFLILSISKKDIIP